MALLRPLTCALLLAALPACAAPEPAQTLRLPGVGTVFEVQAHGPPSGWLQAAEPRMRARLARWQRDAYPFQAGELWRANDAWRGGACFAASPALIDLVSRAQALERRGGDSFVPALADLTAAWRFDGMAAEDWSPPSADTIAALLDPPPTSLRLRVEDARICADGRVTLDPGGFGKGLIVEELLVDLAAAGVAAVSVSADGDTMVRGRRGTRPWRVAIANPSGDGALAMLTLADGEAAFTAGGPQRSFELNGKQHIAVLDPRTGRPVQGVVSATTVGHDAPACDAAAAALAVTAARARAAGHGPDDLGAVARGFGVDAFAVVLADGTVWLDTAMQDRLTWPGAVPPTQIVTERK